MKLIIEIFKFLCVIAFGLVVCAMVFGCSMLPGIGQMSDRWCNAHSQAGEYQCTGRALAQARTYCQYGEHPGDANCAK